MLDQAARLRELAASYRAQAGGGTAPRVTRAIAVTSGKGGVGKSNMSVNLAHALTAAGKEVILLDADLGMANADILMGIVPPYHLGHLMRGEREIKEIMYRTPSQIRVIAGGSGLEELANLSSGQLRPFLQAIHRLDGEADYLILDTGAGVGVTVQEFVLAADMVLVVTTPEPTSLADAYGAIKAMAHRNPTIDVRLVINQVERPEDSSQAAERIVTTARDFLGLHVEVLGAVPRDPLVGQAVRRQVPFFLGSPKSPASRAVEMMATRLINGGTADDAARPPAPRFFERLTGLFGRRGAGPV